MSEQPRYANLVEQAQRMLEAAQRALRAGELVSAEELVVGAYCVLAAHRRTARPSDGS
jgi:hypothetical protein